MCGGPVVLMQDMQQCIGIIEAAVAPLKKGDENNETKVFLQDKVVIIPSIVISKFLKVITIILILFFLLFFVFSDSSFCRM